MASQLFEIPAVEVDAPGTTPSAHHFAPASDGPRARHGIIVLPITGGDYDVARLFAEHFAGAGYAALMIERRTEWLDPARPIRQLAPLFEAYLGDIERGIDAWRAAMGLERVGIFGVSMGAIVGSRVISARTDIDAAVLCIGGGPLWQILTDSADPEMRAYRKGVAQHLKMPLGMLPDLLRRSLEPLESQYPVSPTAASRILYYTAALDRVVKPKHATALWHALGRPRRRWLPTGHYSAAVAVPWIKRESLAFFDEKLRA